MAREFALRSLECLLVIAWLTVSAGLGYAQQPDVSCAPDCGGGTYAVAVEPDNMYQDVLANQQTTVTFTVANTGTVIDGYSFPCTATGSVTCAFVSPQAATVGAGRSITVTVYINAGPLNTSGVIQLQAFSSSGAQDVGWYNISNVGAKPVVDTTAVNYSDQQVARCALTCFAATYGQGTVPYFSLDGGRNVTLAYDGDRVDPWPFIHMNVKHGGSAQDFPTAFWLQARKANGTLITFLNGETKLRFTPSSQWVRLAGQFSAAANGISQTGAYGLDLLVTSEYGTGTPRTVITSTTLVVVNEAGSPIARGWTLPGIQRLYPQPDGSALVTEGDGSAVYFSIIGGLHAPAGDFSSLISGTPSGAPGWTRRYPDSTKVVFDNTGRMIELRDRFNNITSVLYDLNGRVSQIKDPLNLAITLNYGTNGLASIVDPIGRTTSMTVDANHLLTAITDPDNFSTAFGYDGSLRLSTVTNRRGATTTLNYDSQSGKLANITASPVLLFDGTTAAPVTTLAPWQKVGVPYGLTTTAAAAPLADTVYARVTDPGGHVTRFTVNRWGAPIQTTDPVANVTTVTYDANGLAARIVYPTGGVDTASYATNGMPTFVQPAGASAINITYGDYAQPTNISGTGRPTIQNFVGPNGRIDSTRVGGFSVTRYRYEARGRPDSVVDAQGHLVQRTWFAGINGNRSKDSLPGGRVTLFYYDGYGRDTAVKAPGVPVRRTHYDILNRPTQAYDGVYATPTVTSYDSLYVRSVTDPKGQVYQVTRNALGWLTQRTDPAGRSDQYAYDLDGALRRWTNRRGQSIDYAHDALHRGTSKSGANTTSESWSYTPDGRVITSTSPLATGTTYLSVLGRPDSVRTVMAGQTYWRRFRYTAAGLLDSVEITGGGIAFRARRYLYNTVLGTLTEVHVGGAITRIGTQADLLPDTVTYPAGDKVIRRFTPLHGVTQISSAAPYGGTIARSLQVDSLSRVTEQLVGDGTSGKRYLYDGLSRVISDADVVASSPPPPNCTGDPPPIIDEYGNNCVNTGGTTWQVVSSVQFAYDSVDNRTDKGGSYLVGNRITNFDGCSYTTDVDGNVTARTCGTQTVTFFWSAESRLDSLTVGTQRVAFKYDAGGRLVRKDLNGVAQSHFLWDGGNLLAELNGVGTAAVAEYSYFPGADNPHAIVVGGQEYHPQVDGLGNVIALTDNAQSVQRTYSYDAWGTLTGGTDTKPFANADRVRFKGALWLGPEVDLYYMRSRWYEPKSGRFLSEDPIGLAGGVNPYVFAGDDPVNGRDPTGLTLCVDAVPWFYVGGDGSVTFLGWQIVRGPYDCGGGGGGGGKGGGAGGGGGGSNAGQGPQGPSCHNVLGGASQVLRANGGFGDRGGTHQGVDILGPIGTPVTAFSNGVVVSAGYNSYGYGMEVIISHTRSDSSVYYSQYAHLQPQLAVARGDVVTAGQLVGGIGMSGNADGLPISQAHLHFELRSVQVPGQTMAGHIDPTGSLCWSR